MSARESADYGESTVDPRSARTRAAIIEATLAILDEGGEPSLRVQQVASRAGVTTGAIYSQFSSREGLIAAANTEFLRQFIVTSLSGLMTIEQTEQTNPLESNFLVEKLSAIFTDEGMAVRLRWAEAAARAEHNPELAKDLDEIQRDVIQGFSFAIRHWQDQGWFRKDINPLTAAALIFGVTIGISVTSRPFMRDPEYRESLPDIWRLLIECFTTHTID